MGATGVLLGTHCVVLFLLQMVARSSEAFTVTGLTKPVLAPVGGTLELSCQLSPPQDAQHMEIRWFRNRYTRPVHLYRDGKDLHGETIPKYVERTELLKYDIGRGKVTLRIFSMTVDDGGPYHCVFKDGEFYEEHITEVKVTATSSDIQILLHPPNTKGVMLECHSGGWFPLPHMEWRDSKGEVIPETSKSHSQDGNKLFNMTMALFINTSSYQSVTCYLQNRQSLQEESTSIILSGELFAWKSVWIWILSMIAFVLIPFLMTSCAHQHFVRGNFSVKNYPCIKSAVAFMGSMVEIIGVILILHLNQRALVSDSYFELDTFWLEDISVIFFVLIVFKIKLISFIFFRLKGKYDGNGDCSKDLVHVTDAQMSRRCPSVLYPFQHSLLCFGKDRPKVNIVNSDSISLVLLFSWIYVSLGLSCETFTIIRRICGLAVISKDHTITECWGKQQLKLPAHSAVLGNRFICAYHKKNSFRKYC
ncbi:selection and upkeep of intraepithelial T-cells protein 2-like [Microtus oregoni]|uniref:selection and upkeep of intraepithelial T-cells protein 2-like n=1 Tax=Microtus oregoni TaxID=111838 RepID=UPI001BB14159|nr:selection and upkeep of intraepithelial T-cells protein 2-like [Microtus oregoni]